MSGLQATHLSPPVTSLDSAEPAASSCTPADCEITLVSPDTYVAPETTQLWVKRYAGDAVLTFGAPGRGNQFLASRDRLGQASRLLNNCFKEKSGERAFSVPLPPRTAQLALGSLFSQPLEVDNLSTRDVVELTTTLSYLAPRKTIYGQVLEALESKARQVLITRVTSDFAGTLQALVERDVPLALNYVAEWASVHPAEVVSVLSTLSTAASRSLLRHRSLIVTGEVWERWRSAAGLEPTCRPDSYKWQHEKLNYGNGTFYHRALDSNTQEVVIEWKNWLSFLGDRNGYKVASLDMQGPTVGFHDKSRRWIFVVSAWDVTVAREQSKEQRNPFSVTMSAVADVSRARPVGETKISVKEDVHNHYHSGETTRLCWGEDWRRLETFHTFNPWAHWNGTLRVRFLIKESTTPAPI